MINENHNLVISAGYDHYNYKTSDIGNAVNAYSMNFAIEQYFLKANFNWLINEKHSLNYGLNSLFYQLNPGSLLPFGQESLVVPKVLSAERATESALYLSDNWSVSDKLSLDLGVRYSFYTAIGEKTYYNYFPGEPKSELSITDTVTVGAGKFIKPYHGPEFRISARYAFDNDFSFKIGFNSMRQNIHMLSNTTAVSPTDT